MSNEKEGEGHTADAPAQWRYADLPEELKGIFDDITFRIEKIERGGGAWWAVVGDQEIWDNHDMEEVRQFLNDLLKPVGNFFPLDIVKETTEEGKIVFSVTCHITETTLRKVTRKKKRLKSEEEIRKEIRESSR